MIIENETYLWEMNDANLPSKNLSGFTSPTTLSSFLCIKPGSTVDLDWLQQETQNAERRLMASGYFYKASVTILTPRKFPDRRTILVQVTEGFLMRFGGGSAYALIGQDNINGERKHWLGVLGLNFLGGEYLDEQVLNSAWKWGISGYYTQTSKDHFLVNSSAKEATLITGYAFSPDLHLDCDWRLNRIESDQTAPRTDILIKPRLFAQWLHGTSAAPGYITEQLQWGWLIPKSDPHIQYGLSKTAFLYSFDPQLVLAGQVCIGYADSHLPSFYQFDLYNTQAMMIRSGYSQAELLVDRFILANLEYRFPIWDTLIPPIIKVYVNGFLFVDAGIGSIYPNTLDQPIKDAFGAGMHIKFDNPVFVDFSFAYGVNHNQKSRIIFLATAGF